MSVNDLSINSTQPIRPPKGQDRRVLHRDDHSIWESSADGADDDLVGVLLTLQGRFHLGGVGVGVDDERDGMRLTADKVLAKE